MQQINFGIVGIVVIGLLGLIIDPLGNNDYFFTIYTKGIECYLFGITAFWVLKRVLFYRFQRDTEVIRLVKTSNYQFNFVLQGFLLSTIYVTYIFFFDNWMGFNVIMIAVLLLYYLVQVYINANPSIYINADAFMYDDYFIQQWNWKNIRRIISRERKLEIIGEENDFALDLKLVDEVDYVKLTDEVEHNVLDGEFTSERSSKLLLDIVHNYADFYGLKIDQS
ncbi:MAG: hypothetical protein AAGD05_00695 [Bacteroidota bacterium]